LGRAGAATYAHACGQEAAGGAAAALSWDATPKLSLAAARFAPSQNTMLQATWRPAPKLALATAWLQRRGGGDDDDCPLASVSACAALGEAATLAGWVAAALPGGPVEWALSVAPPPPGVAASPPLGWGVVLGRPLGQCAAEAEAFLAIGARGGDGWSAVPSVMLRRADGGGYRLRGSVAATFRMAL